MKINKDHLTVTYNPDNILALYNQTVSKSESAPPEPNRERSLERLESTIKKELERWWEVGGADIVRDSSNVDNIGFLVTREGDGDLPARSLDNFAQEIYKETLGLGWLVFAAAHEHIRALDSAKYTYMGQKWVEWDAYRFKHIAGEIYGVADPAIKDMLSEEALNVARTMPDLRIMRLVQDKIDIFQGFLDILNEADLAYDLPKAIYNQLGELAESFGVELHEMERAKTEA